MSSSGLIYAVIVGAWAAYLVPMWLRRQDELNEARPTERFSTAIRLLSGRAAMERRYARDLRERSDETADEQSDPDDVTSSVDVRALAVPTRTEPRPARFASDEAPDRERQRRGGSARARGRLVPGRDASASAAPASAAAASPAAGRRAAAARQFPGQAVSARYEPGQDPGARGAQAGRPGQQGAHRGAEGNAAGRRSSALEAAARAQRSKVLARRRRTTIVLFFAFTLGAVIAAVGGIAFLWVPGVPAVLLSAYIVYLRRQEQRRFMDTMDRRRAEAAAQWLRERQPRRKPGSAAPGSDASGSVEPGDDGVPGDAGDAAGPDGGPQSAALSALAAGRRALVEQTDHAEWVDQQRERRRAPTPGESWDPVPVPLPTYVTAPVAPRGGSDIDDDGADEWSATRSSAAEPPAEGSAGPSEGARGGRPADPGADRADGSPDQKAAPGRAATRRRGGDRTGTGTSGTARGTRSRGRNARGDRDGTGRAAAPEGPTEQPGQDEAGGGRSDARRAASARRSRERGRTPLFDQYAEGERPRAANQ